MSILLILNLLCYLLEVNNLLSLVCCWIRLATWRCRNIAMWKMTMNTLTTRLNLIFADSDIWKFGYRNNLFLSECAHLICRLRHMTTTLGVRTIVVKLQLLRENTAILTWSLDVNLRLILLRGSCGPWRMQTVKTLGSRLSQIYNNIRDSAIWSLRRNMASNIFLVVLRWRRCTLDLFHDLDQVLLGQIIWGILPRVPLTLRLPCTSVIVGRRNIQAIVAFLNLTQFCWRYSGRNTALMIAIATSWLTINITDYSIVPIGRSIIHGKLSRMNWGRSMMAFTLFL